MGFFSPPRMRVKSKVHEDIFFWTLWHIFSFHTNSPFLLSVIWQCIRMRAANDSDILLWVSPSACSVGLKCLIFPMLLCSSKRCRQMGFFWEVKKKGEAGLHRTEWTICTWANFIQHHQVHNSLDRKHWPSFLCSAYYFNLSIGKYSAKMKRALSICKLLG